MRLSFDIDKVEKHENSLKRMRRDGNIYLTKHPLELPYVWPRLFLDPNFFVLCLMRDPRDAIVSRHRSHKDFYLADLGRWKLCYRIIRKLQDHPRFILIKYEDLVSDPDGVQTRIAERLPFLKQTKNFTAFHQAEDVHEHSVRALNGVRPIDSSSISSWRSHRERVAEQIAEFGDIADVLIELSYESDRQWTQMLPAVSNPQPRVRAGLVDRILVSLIGPVPTERSAAYHCFKLARMSVLAVVCRVCATLKIPYY